MQNREHVIKNGDIELIINDLNTSETMVHMKEQVFEQDEYGLNNIKFNPGDVVIDIGANVGCVSLLLAKRYPDIKIYAYEAHPINYQNLLNNIKLNDIKNIIPNNFIVSNVDNDTLKITLNPHNTGSSSVFKTNDFDKNTYDVKTISLDTIINSNNIENIKLLKIDCEGCEFNILENSKKIHELSVENIATEIHTFVKDGNVEKLVDLITKVSINKPIYKIYTLG